MIIKEYSVVFSSLVIILTLLFPEKSESARILAIFPTPSISHQVVFRPITQELARRGHEVIVVTANPAFPKGKAPKNLTEIDVHDFSYKIKRESWITVTGDVNNKFKQLESVLKLLCMIFEKQLQTEAIKNIIQNNNKSFDLLLIELCIRPALVFSHIFKAPVIQISSLGGAPDSREMIGAPTHPLLYPSAFRQKLNNLTMWDKLTEVYNMYKFKEVVLSQDKFADATLKKIFGKDTPNISELLKNVHMVFLNLHPIWDGNVPVPPSLIYIGGIHQQPLNELPHDLKSQLDIAKNGVIYMSFGTNTDPSSLPPEKKRIFFKVLSESPYQVLWKWNNDDVPGHATNIKYSKWFPQSDLLRHPNVKLFITQGGLQSTDETILAGVPAIGIPMLWDQRFNVEKYVQHEIGVRLDLKNLTEENLKAAIDNVIKDERYRNNVIKLRNIMYDQPMSPLDRAVFWAEYVIRHGGAEHLRSPAANISWREYLELDLVFTLLGIISAFFIVIVMIGYHAMTFVFRFLNKKKIKIA